MNSQTEQLKQNIKSIRQDHYIACPWCKSTMWGKHWRRGLHFRSISAQQCKMRSQEAVEEAKGAGIEISVAQQAWIPLAVIMETAPKKEESKKPSKKLTKELSPGALFFNHTELI